MPTFAADIRAFADRTVGQMRDVMRESTQDVVQAAQTPQVSLARGATGVVQGKIPVDTGFLRNSLVSGLNGSFGPEGPESYALTVAGMEIGDVARFAWTAPHALPTELGHGSYKGAHFVGANAARWSDFVAANVAKLK